jgi:RHH-type rel operon transcriptional repressor/antitoxin RelB
MKSVALTLRLDASLKKRLEKLAHSTHRTRSFLAAEAIREFVELNEWQIQEIQKGVEEADRGDFATNKEVARVMKKWSNRAR